MSRVMILVFFAIWQSAKSEPVTTTRTYDIDVPGSSPIRIVEGEPLWETTTESATTSSAPVSPKSPNKFEHRSFKNSYDYLQTQSTESDEITTPDSLEDFLKSYAEKLRRNNKKKPQFSAVDEKLMENVELITKPTDGPTNRLASLHINRHTLSSNEDEEMIGDEEKSKSWNLLNYQKHNHPYEDKKGWVSMEPVPWSVSKISKWQSSQKTTQRPSYSSNNYNEHAIESGYGESFPRPSWSQKPFTQALTLKPSFNPYDRLDLDEPYNTRPIRPISTKPSAIYGQKVQIDYYDNKRGHHNNNNQHHVHDENCDHPENSGEIITDGLPPNFPHNGYYGPNKGNRRRGTEVHPESHPFSGPGDWVLLSTTKGYKYPPNKQRSLDIQPESIGTTRAVRLTVLPPLKNSKVNMTTSHGGLLQVESTFQTVEQAKNQFFKKQRQKQQHKLQKIKKPKRQQQNANKPVRQVGAPTAVTTTRRISNTADTSAVLAAVGAGMIPATMAMLVPMALGGRRRRRDVYQINPPFYAL